MDELLVVALAGFFAAFVDGSLGMGFGPTSASLLLGAGMSPASVSTTVNVVKVVTGAAAGAAHWRLGNVDRRLVLRLVGPGCVGALVGVTVLAGADAEAIRPILALILLGLSIRILVRAGRFRAPGPTPPSATTRRRDPVVPLAAVAGGVSNGLVGSWGPVVTPVVMDRPGAIPRKAVGSVTAAEVAVASVTAGALIGSVGAGEVDLAAAGALLVGGLIAAPLSAWTVRRVHPRALAVGVGLVLGLTNLRILANWLDLGVARWVVYGTLVALAVVVVVTGRHGGPGTGEGDLTGRGGRPEGGGTPVAGDGPAGCPGDDGCDAPLGCDRPGGCEGAGGVVSWVRLRRPTSAPPSRA